MLPVVDRVAAELGPPTEFEVLTAAAYAELASAGLDLALVEVGMGGRLDATNSGDFGVAAIVNVQHDHEAHLGRTLAAIGGEKAPIIKRGDLAVTGASGRGLRPIIDRCAALDVPLRRAGPAAAVSGCSCATSTGRAPWWTPGRRPASCATSGSASSAHTRRTTPPSRSHCSMRSSRTRARRNHPFTLDRGRPPSRPGRGPMAGADGG